MLRNFSNLTVIFVMVVIAFLAQMVWAEEVTEELSAQKSTLYISASGFMSNEVREVLNSTAMFDNYDVVTDRRSATHEMRIRINRIRVSSSGQNFRTPPIRIKTGGNRYSIPVYTHTNCSTYTFMVLAIITGKAPSSKRVWPNEQQPGGYYTELGTDRNSSFDISLIHVYTQGYGSFQGLAKAVGQLMVESKAAMNI